MRVTHVDHGSLTTEEIVNLLASEVPGYRMRIRHPKAEGYVYIKLITRVEYEDGAEGED